MRFDRSAHAPARVLLEVCGNPGRACALSLDEWDLVVRAAGAAKLLATLGARLAAERLLPRLPRAVADAMESEAALARYRDQMARLELRRVARALAPLDVPIVLLKGVAYLIEGLAIAGGRLLADVDILVPRDRLEAAERALVQAGWRSSDLDELDQRYYREWSHELPPLRFPDHPLELDVHHTILPVTGRLHPDAAALFAASRAAKLEGFRVLSPEDQVLHACVHLFQDSDLSNRLRDLIDIDGLARELGRDEAFWDRLLARSRQHGLDRPLWYALHFAADALGTTVPRRAFDALVDALPSRIARALMDRLLPLALLPSHPDGLPPLRVRLSRAAMRARYQWLRLPPRLLATHALGKAFRGLRMRLSPATPEPSPH